ncbi:MAG TPA: hypothetical protein VGX94_19435 [Terriglobia bacterium]|nr:hypothetical protein [Terriglobia bacterium]
MNRRERAGMPGVQQLQQVKGFSSPDFAQDNPVRPVAERGFEKISNGNGWNTVLLVLRLKADQVIFVPLNLSSILDDNEAFVIKDEASKDIEQRRLATSGPAADEDIPAVEYSLFQDVRAGPWQCPNIDEVLNGVPGVELADSERHAVHATRRDDCRNPAAVRQA